MERAIIRHWSEALPADAPPVRAPLATASALLEGASDIFERGGKKKAEVDGETVRSLHAKIGD
ncbi:MAG: hypothetical protein AB7S99_12360 [Pseudodonghicola sp.]